MGLAMGRIIDDVHISACIVLKASFSFVLININNNYNYNNLFDGQLIHASLSQQPLARGVLPYRRPTGIP